jgi:hypothetical protein
MRLTTLFRHNPSGFLRVSLQKGLVLFNFPPFSLALGAIYAHGLKKLVTALENHPAVHSVYGCGSYFEGKCMYGRSDIDLIIVIGEEHTRVDGDVYDIARDYMRIRRIFPFLGRWHEKAANLIFLSEIREGFPVPESFRLRAKQGRLTLLCGEEFPVDYREQEVTLGEVAAEMNTLLHTPLTTGDVYVGDLLFWKKIFTRLLALAGLAGLEKMSEEMRREASMGFLKRGDLALFYRRSEPEKLFPILLSFIRRIHGEIAGNGKMVSINYRTCGNGQPGAAGEGSASLEGCPTAVSRALLEEGGFRRDSLPSALLGLIPRLNYFPMGRDIGTVEVDDHLYRRLIRIRNLLNRRGTDGENLLVRAAGFLFVMSRQQHFVEIVPLDPLSCANTYAGTGNGDYSFRMPAPLYEELLEISRNMFKALAAVYDKTEGRVVRMPFPCLYLEDDLVVLRDAFHRLRVFILHAEGIDCDDPGTLVTLLAEKHPGSAEFLEDFLDYYRHLSGEGAVRRPAGNLYRCLHRFMAQALSGEENISVNGHRKKLGITVGIITRNRADDLREALESLTRQVRPADEVLVLDNGSTDDTAGVVAGFRDSLPITGHFLEDASIPAARNMVIDRARNEVVAFTDADCLADPLWLESVEWGFLRADNVGMVGGWVKHAPAPEETMVDTYCSIFHHNKT